jgi:succinate dehydrogenase/fumarate reductase iron-sulfur protein
MAEQVSITVFKYDPSVDAAPYTDTFEMEWKEYLTALEALHYYNENISPLAYDYCCRAMLCGRCSMMIDGVPGLACFTVLAPGSHTIEPLRGLPVIKDLCVDRKFQAHKISESLPSVKTTKAEVGLPDIEYDFYWETLERLQMCRECMCCYANCQALNDFKKQETYIGPAAMTQIALRYYDEEDMYDRVGQAVFAGLYDCVLCGNCTAVCPSGIDHLSAWADLRNAAEARNLRPESA